MTFAEQLVHVFHSGRALSFARSAEHSTSTFGGPLEADVRGGALGAPLHHVATLGVDHLRPLGVPWRFGELPLVFSLRHSGCEIAYAFDVDTIRVESLAPAAPTPDWPYRGVPELLPCAPLEPGAAQATTWDAFRSRAPNLAPEPPAQLVVLVPPPATLGVSLWGRAGDAEGVTLVFACDLGSRRVRASTVTT
jgi:hypothetical protein